ncbi:MAG: putative signal transducing protein [Planctomycetota bacterium]|jgi:hypothetical protein
MNDHSSTTTMQCLECGNGLDGVNGEACPECDRAFDPKDFESFRRVLESPVKVHSTESVPEAYALRATLEEAGIHATVEDAAAGVLGIIEAEGGIWVNENSMDRAKAIVATALREQHDGESWQCTACGEQVDPGFEVCWNCQADRAGT